MMEYPVERPQVWPWQVAYCVLMAVVYAAVVAFGVFLLVMGESLGPSTTQDPVGIRIQAIIMMVMGVPFFLMFAAAPFLPRRPWVWIYHLVLIGLTMTSCACLPFAIPLIIFWLKPETKAYFHPVDTF